LFSVRYSIIYFLVAFGWIVSTFVIIFSNVWLEYNFYIFGCNIYFYLLILDCTAVMFRLSLIEIYFIIYWGITRFLYWSIRSLMIRISELLQRVLYFSDADWAELVLSDSSLTKKWLLKNCYTFSEKFSCS